MHRRQQEEIMRHVAFEVAAHLRTHGAPSVTVTAVTLDDTTIRCTAKSLLSHETCPFSIHIFPSAAMP